MQKVFVLDERGNPLMPCHPARARKLLKKGRAVVARRAPFTIRLKDRVGGEVQPVRLKIDPGSRTTGMALVRENDGQAEVLHLAELHHKRGIRKRMEQRRQYRRRRRSANLRYRPPRFLNRSASRREGRLPPSLSSRVDHVSTWVRRYRRLAPVSSISVELARFDTQKMEDPEVSGVEYQQGELAGYEVREYLLEKWGRRCAYCGIENVPLEVEHIVPSSRGGSNRVSNLTLACHDCNQEKGNRTASEFGHPEVQVQARMSLKDAAAVNATRWAVYRMLAATGLPVEVGTGGRTKYNRTRLGLRKTHALDAVCVGASTPDEIAGLNGAVALSVRAVGRGSYQRTRLTRHGFLRGYLMREKSVEGFRTGDLVRAVVPKGKCAGVHEGVVAVRKSGYFAIRHGGQLAADGISARYCQLLQRADGYTYEKGEAASSPD
ncbi:MAG: HNH endonuclease [Anaerolineae bacterium]|nr:HNH endonuclease [Anaerolineae bacterium]